MGTVWGSRVALPPANTAGRAVASSRSSCAQARIAGVLTVFRGILSNSAASAVLCPSSTTPVQRELAMLAVLRVAHGEWAAGVAPLPRRLVPGTGRRATTAGHRVRDHHLDHCRHPHRDLPAGHHIA